MEHSQEQLTKLRLSPMPPDNERDHEHDRSYSPPLSARFPQPPPLSLRDQGTLANKRLSLSSSISSGSSSKQPFVDKGPSTHQDISSIEAGDSISSISMHDLPSDDGSASEDDVLTTTNYPVPFRHRPPSLNLRSGKHLLASQHLLPSPLQTSGMTLSPQTPAISHTPPTPQSPAFGQPTSADATLPPSISRLKGRFSSTAGRPAHSTTVNIDLSGPSAPDTPIEPSTPATSSTMNAMPLTPSSQSTFVSPTPTYPTQLRPQSPPEATVEFPTQVQFPRSSDSPLDDIYTPTDDPLLLHRELRSARSRSASHKKRLNSSKPSTPVRSPTFPLEGENVEDETVAVLPRSRSSSNISVSVAERAAGRRAVTGPPPSAFRGPPPRAGSPDIEDLLESTPRPRRRGSSASRMSASTSVSSFGSTRSRSASRPRKGRKSGTSVKTLESRRRASEGQFRNRDESQFAELERELEGLGSDDELVGYAGRRERFGSGYDFEASRSLTASEDELIMEDDGSASDSSLDIHTPLP
ncbi:hypothetical protein V5O48_005927 [Marasmius crinis-equi]|uniref:Uncharacterized protein n=1 Tax=Marasmius crinis-equi TaxID=585013 RepID=A0ABR3FLS8_9AGAR